MGIVDSFKGFMGIDNEEENHEYEEGYGEEDEDEDEDFFEVECPNCEEPLVIDDEALEEGVVVCPNCETKFALDLTDDDAEDEDEEESHQNGSGVSLTENTAVFCKFFRNLSLFYAQTSNRMESPI